MIPRKAPIRTARATEPIPAGAAVYQVAAGAPNTPVGIALCNASPGDDVSYQTQAVVTVKLGDWAGLPDYWASRGFRPVSEAEHVEAEMNRDVRDERFMREGD